MERTWKQVGRLCRGNPGDIGKAFEGEAAWLAFCLAVIVVGSGSYGATIGLGRSYLQSLYTAVKFPLLMLLTTAANSLLNAMLAQVLGLRISFRHATLSIVTSFASASAILGSLGPVALFLWWNVPPFGSEQGVPGHNTMLVTHVFLIAFAGTAGNASLFRFLVSLSGERAKAGKILAAWLGGNMFLGCQLSWIMRPFVGSPGLPVEFLRADAFQGNFYESVFNALVRLAS